MQELQCRNSILITNADKGGVVIILDIEDYVKKAENLTTKKTTEKKTTTLVLIIMKLSTKFYQDFEKKLY